MSYNRVNYQKVRELFDEKSKTAQREADARAAALHREHPELAEIDRALSQTGVQVFAEAVKGKEGLPERLAALQKENEDLQKSRAQCLQYYGYPADYTDPRYECAVCRDTGIVGDRMCACFKRALVLATYESSGIGNLLRTQSFDTFDLAYYPDPKSRELAESALRVCRDFAEHFPDAAARSLTMQGATGLGKTHLTTSIAKTVIDRGYDVVYETAQNIFYALEEAHFGRSDGSDTDRFFQCDLLILDDLGTEMTTAFTVSALYNLLNTRTNAGKSTVINTNITPEECRRRYQDRITSRLFGEFTLIPLRGTDIRMQKLKQENLRS